MSQKSSNNQSIFGLIAFILIIGGLYFFMGSKEDNKKDSEVKDFSAEEVVVSSEGKDLSNSLNPVAVLETEKGNIEIELYMDKMPITAGNFKKLVEDGFYDGIRFHRVIDNFMVQGGDPLSKDLSQEARWGTGGPGYAIEDEFVEGLSNVKGTISMANSGPNTGGSQFFINTVDNVYLDFDKEPSSSKHPVFGQVISGMDIVLQIQKGDLVKKVYIK